MSGRDYRAFVTSHRSNIELKDDHRDNSIDWVNGGLHCRKYKPVDYEKLKKNAAEKKLAASKSYLKVKKISQFSRESKEQSFIKQHKLLWQKEFIRLRNLRDRYQADCNNFLLDCSGGEILYELQTHQTLLESNLIDFQRASVKQIQSLREYLQDSNILDKKDDVNCQQDIDAIRSMLGQHNDSIEHLEIDQISQETELKSSSIWNTWQSHEKRIVIGIPLEAFDIDCPDCEMKSSILNEFSILDAKFTEHLADLDGSHSFVKDGHFGNWNEVDHNKFECIRDQYPRDMPNREQLYMDRLQREFRDSFSKTELIEHDKWSTLNNYYKDRRKAIINDWHRDRAELLNKIKNTFADLRLIYDRAHALECDRQKQTEICRSLREKVCVWREQKSELMELAAAVERKRKEKEEHNYLKELEGQRRRRVIEKMKIRQYHLEKEQKESQMQEDMIKRMETLKKALEMQAAYDQERIVFREHQYHLKLQAKEQKEFTRLQHEADKHCRLEAIRELVRVEAVKDPKRLMSDTEVWKTHKYKPVDGADEVKPIYQLNTFNEAQITSDNRIKFEERLRAAGVHNSDYAREMLSMVKPPTQPRRDMESTLFNRDSSLKL
ncbi:coiled-coil domain-containing protein 148-like isoform X1 [Tubulanus polymorphus]|uniref:coiled-coil domain-containing protein 148-like isoform X1 n=1 Tax=Tubulanus polymorphus TaxID=672921 RepID=UPI003DA68EED